MKIDFTKLEIEIDFDGTTEVVNCAKEIANFVRNRTPDIGMEDLCREIYYSDGEIDIADEYIQPFILIATDVCSPFKAASKRAIRDILIPDKA